MSDKIYFISVAEATEIISIMASKTMRDAWKEATEDEKISALTQSGLVLNNLEFRGTSKVDIDQPYSFPRFMSCSYEQALPVYRNYQDYELAQALQAGYLVSSSDKDIEVYNRISNVQSEKSGTTSVSYFQSDINSDEYIADNNGLYLGSYKLIKNWLMGGY